MDDVSAKYDSSIWTSSEDLNTASSQKVEQNQDYVKVILRLFYLPCLTLLKAYLWSSNDDPDKSLKSCLMDFRRKHPIYHSISFLIDFSFRMFSIIFVFLVIARGLWVVDILEKIFIAIKSLSI